jgi:hypothetical protein
MRVNIPRRVMRRSQQSRNTPGEGKREMNRNKIATEATYAPQQNPRKAISLLRWLSEYSNNSYSKRNRGAGSIGLKPRLLDADFVSCRFYSPPFERGTNHPQSLLNKFCMLILAASDFVKKYFFRIVWPSSQAENSGVRSCRSYRSGEGKFSSICTRLTPRINISRFVARFRLPAISPQPLLF